MTRRGYRIPLRARLLALTLFLPSLALLAIILAATDEGNESERALNVLWVVLALLTAVQLLAALLWLWQYAVPLVSLQIDTTAAAAAPTPAAAATVRPGIAAPAVAVDNAAAPCAL